ncbi:uncharacterized [Tachysurus ichikawai]
MTGGLPGREAGLDCSGRVFVWNTGRGFCQLSVVARRCWVTAWEVLKFHSVTAFDTIAAARLQTQLRLFCALSQLEDPKELIQVRSLKLKRNAGSLLRTTQIAHRFPVPCLFIYKICHLLL